MEILDTLLPRLLCTAWLLPLASFVAILFFGPRMGKAGKCAGYVATGAIMLSFVCSAVAMSAWLWHHPIEAVHHVAAEGEGHAAETPSEHQVEAAADVVRQAERVRVAEHGDEVRGASAPETSPIRRAS